MAFDNPFALLGEDDDCDVAALISKVKKAAPAPRAVAPTLEKPRPVSDESGKGSESQRRGRGVGGRVNGGRSGFGSNGGDDNGYSRGYGGGFDGRGRGRGGGRGGRGQGRGHGFYGDRGFGNNENRGENGEGLVEVGEIQEKGDNFVQRRPRPPRFENSGRYWEENRQSGWEERGYDGRGRGRFVGYRGGGGRRFDGHNGGSNIREEGLNKPEGEDSGLDGKEGNTNNGNAAVGG